MISSRRIRRSLVFLFVGILVSMTNPAGAFHGHSEPRFWGLGDLPGGATISYAYDLSRRGDVICGESFSDISQVHGEGVRWRRESPSHWQMTGMGLPTVDSLNSPASAISGNEHWIVALVSFVPPTPPAIHTDPHRSPTPAPHP